MTSTLRFQIIPDHLPPIFEAVITENGYEAYHNRDVMTLAHDQYMVVIYTQASQSDMDGVVVIYKGTDAELFQYRSIWMERFLLFSEDTAEVVIERLLQDMIRNNLLDPDVYLEYPPIFGLPVPTNPDSYGAHIRAHLLALWGVDATNGQDQNENA